MVLCQLESAFVGSEVCGIFQISFGMNLTSILHSCEFFKVDPLAVPTVICLSNGLLFSLGAVVIMYMYVALLSATHESLSLFSIFFVVWVADFE